MSDEPAERSSKQGPQQREAGVAEPKRVRLSPNPPTYHAPYRDESGPEAYPPATIPGTFRPIEDRGAETPVPLPQQHKDAEYGHSQDTAVPSDLPGEEES